MAAEFTDARPLQVRVADDIRIRIEQGEYAPGARLPTLDQLAEQHRCSLAVVRKAVDLLKQQGLVVTVQGRGTFVRDRPHARRHGIERYSRSRWGAGTAVLVAEAEEQGRTAEQHIRELAEVPAPDAVAERLGTTVDDTAADGGGRGPPASCQELRGFRPWRAGRPTRMRRSSPAPPPPA
jgi:GntR family transcriptional regulator